MNPTPPSPPRLRITTHTLLLYAPTNPERSSFRRIKRESEKANAARSFKEGENRNLIAFLCCRGRALKGMTCKSEERERACCRMRVCACMSCPNTLDRSSAHLLSLLPPFLFVPSIESFFLCLFFKAAVSSYRCLGLALGLG